jgi:hypothetical protein
MGVKMTTSRRIAGLLGPALIAITISESMNLRIWTTSSEPSISNLAPVVYLNGTLLFVAGLSIVRAHNRWTGGWPVLVTLMGWLFLLGGLIRMFAPVSAQRSVQDTTVVLAGIVVLLAIGILLTVKAYGREDRQTAVQAGRAR